jgi:hypothetical protein
MSNPILTEEEQKAADLAGQQVKPSEPSANSANMPTPAQQAQQISDQSNTVGAVLPPEQAAQVTQQTQGSNPQEQVQPQQAIEAVSMGAPQPQPQPVPKSQSEEIDKTIRGLLIQIIALQHNKEAQQ